MSIILFSREIRSGKTSEIQRFVKGEFNVGGILMPDIKGLRQILDIRTGQQRQIQVEELKPNSIQIGKFYFDPIYFNWANECISHELNLIPDLLIIDEVGKLELKDLGLHTSVSKAIETYNITDSSKQLLLVVRDSLLNEVVEYFNLKQYEVISNLDQFKI